MLLPPPRGPLTEAAHRLLRAAPALLAAPDDGAATDPARDPGPAAERRLAALRADAAGDPERVLLDEDLQAALWTLYELHWRGFDDVDDEREWDPDVLRLRAALEVPFEAALRAAAAPLAAAGAGTEDVPTAIRAVIDADDGPSLASYVHREADADELLDFLRQRSVYHLRESDPQSLLLARLDGRPKVALAELLYDEFGDGEPERLHAALFAEGLRAAGLDPEYGAYAAEATAATLVSVNAMSLMALHRRLRGAALGHLAVFEATSSVPCRRIAAGVERLGFDAAVAAYWHEHVEADAVHEQVALRDVCGTLVEDEPELRGDVLLGAGVCVLVDALAARETLDRWAAARDAAPSTLQATLQSSRAS